MVTGVLLGRLTLRDVLIDNGQTRGACFPFLFVGIVSMIHFEIEEINSCYPYDYTMYLFEYSKQVAHREVQ